MRDFPATGLILSKTALTHHHDHQAGCLNELFHDPVVTIIAYEQAGALLKSGNRDKTHGKEYVTGIYFFWVLILLVKEVAWAACYSSLFFSEQI